MKSDGLISSFKYAIDGIKKAYKAERNLKIHVLAMIIVILLGFILKIAVWEWVVCIVLFALVIGAELFNTSIEEVVNLLSPGIRIHAKYAKDIAAGAVLVNAFFAGYPRPFAAWCQAALFVSSSHFGPQLSPP